MDAGRASKTAMLVAAYRARATAKPGRICNDPWAARLAGAEGHEYAALHDRAWAPAELWLAIRTAWIDREVRAFLDAPLAAKQVVILGAGLDTRAERMRREGVRFFEVDHPDSQRDKLARLRALGDYPVDVASYVSCDFERERFLEKLAGAGYRATEPAIFVWEGVVLYLPEAAIRETVRTIASQCHPQSPVMFDYIGRAMGQGDVTAEDDVAVRKLLADLMEPVRFGTDDVLPLLYEEGMRSVRTRSFDELCLELTGEYDRARKFRFQRMGVTSRAPIAIGP